jgi:streptogramin lyase
MKGRIGTALAACAIAACAVLPASAAAAPGDLYVTDYSNDALYRIDPNTGGVTLVVQDAVLFNSPAGLTFDQSGKLLVATYESGLVRVDPQSGVVVPVVGDPPLEQATGVAVTRGRNIFLSDQGLDNGGRISRIDGSSAVTLAPGLDAGPLDTPDGLTATPQGNLLAVSREDPKGVVRVDSGTGAIARVTNGTMFNDPYGIDRAPDGNIYVADEGAGKIFKVARDGSKQVVASGAPLTGPYGVFVEPNRKLLVVDYGAPGVFEVDPVSGSKIQVDVPGTLLGPLDVVIQPRKCGGLTPTVVGSNGPDKIKASPFADVIATLGGHDVVKGLAGKDVVCGGGGPDKLVGGKGGDRLVGGKGKDRLIGGKGRDACIGGPGRDRQLSC